jgi:hypothetical protein
MSPSEPPSSDRRAAERHLACFPASVERPDGEMRTSIIRDLSVSGALLLVRTELDVGQAVKLTLHISEDLAQAREARGTIVRVVPLADDEIGLWVRKVAVKFDEALTIYEKEIDSLRERQARLGLT